jgi:hypothetical protein
MLADFRCAAHDFSTAPSAGNRPDAGMKSKYGERVEIGSARMGA